MSTPPPSRYRVVERDRRLVVVDSWAKNAPPGEGKPAPRPGVAGTPGARLPGTTRPGIASPRGATGLAGILVRIACFGSDDGDGHPILSTVAYYDDRGPRDITLAPAGERRLGRMLVTVIVALFVAVVLLSLVLPFLVVLFFAAIAVNAGMSSFAKPIVTRWLDGLESLDTA